MASRRSWLLPYLLHLQFCLSSWKARNPRLGLSPIPDCGPSTWRNWPPRWEFSVLLSGREEEGSVTSTCLSPKWSVSCVTPSTPVRTGSSPPQCGPFPSPPYGESFTDSHLENCGSGQVGASLGRAGREAAGPPRWAGQGPGQGRALVELAPQLPLGTLISAPPAASEYSNDPIIQQSHFQEFVQRKHYLMSHML